MFERDPDHPRRPAYRLLLATGGIFATALVCAVTAIGVCAVSWLLLSRGSVGIPLLAGATDLPVAAPTAAPTSAPTLPPTSVPTQAPMIAPTQAPTASPAVAVEITDTPSPALLTPTVMAGPSPTPWPTAMILPSPTHSTGPTAEPVYGPPPGVEILAPGVWKCPDGFAGAQFYGNSEADTFHKLTHDIHILDQYKICFQDRASAEAYGYTPDPTCNP